MQGNPCYARLFADLTHTPQGAFSCPFGTIHLVSPNPIIASGGQSRAPPVAGGARRKPSEQGSARKAPRADAARLLRTALRPPSPQGFLDKLAAAPFGAAVVCGRLGGRRGRRRFAAKGRKTGRRPGNARLPAGGRSPPAAAPRGGNCNTIPWGKEIANRIQAAGYMTMQRDGIKRPTRCRRRWRTWC